MTFNIEALKASSKKDFLVIVHPCTRITDFTLYSGNTYYNVFSISDKLSEYPFKVEIDGVLLTMDVVIPTTSGRFFYDYSTKKLYINNGGSLSTSFVAVTFSIHIATSDFYYYIDPIGQLITLDKIFYDPRIKNASIPEITKEDLLLYGSNSGGLECINLDGAFYPYERTSFYNKEIFIYQAINGVDNIKLIYKGIIESSDINDDYFSLTFRQVDFLFNNKFLSNSPNTLEQTYLSKDEWPDLDPAFDLYPLRQVYGFVYDLIPINIDFSEEPTQTNNRSYLIRSSGSFRPILEYYSDAGSTTTQFNYAGAIGFLPDDTVNIYLSGVPYAVKVETVVQNSHFTYKMINTDGTYTPLPSAPTITDRAIRRGIGYIKIITKGRKIRLRRNIDYTEQVFTGLSGNQNALGFTLTDDFENNYPIEQFQVDDGGIDYLFDPSEHLLSVMVYGVSSTAQANDSTYEILTRADQVFCHILGEKLGISIDDTSILALSLPMIGLSIPMKHDAEMPSYRDVLSNLQTSTCTYISYNDDQEMTVKKIGLLGAAIKTISDTDLLSFDLSYDSDDFYGEILLKYQYRQITNRMQNEGWRNNRSLGVILTLDESLYLHKNQNIIEVETCLVFDSDISAIGSILTLVLSDLKRTYSFRTKTQLHDIKIGDVVELSREKLDGFRYTEGTLRIKKMKITSIKKELSYITFTADPQILIEDYL
jgi:hypothetical protein